MRYWLIVRRCNTLTIIVSHCAVVLHFILILCLCCDVQEESERARKWLSRANFRQTANTAAQRYSAFVSWQKEKEAIRSDIAQVQYGKFRVKTVSPT